MIQSKPLDFRSSFEFGGDTYTIRPVKQSDIETLRVWKNRNRQYFFHQEIINSEQQERWFSKFAEDSGQQLFVCTKGPDSVAGPERLLACVGYRLRDAKRVELFNLICGETSLNGRGFMIAFFVGTLDGLRGLEQKEIELKVLTSNTRALNWYKRQGFRAVGEDKLSFHLILSI